MKFAVVHGVRAHKIIYTTTMAMVMLIMMMMMMMMMIIIIIIIMPIDRSMQKERLMQ